MKMITLNEATKLLSDAGIESAREEARQIFSRVGKIPAHKLIGGDAVCDEPEVREAIMRRAKREPLQYIIGEVDFYRERYKVTPDCLIPRADTEILVDFAVKNLPEGCTVLDICTGSGCVAISTVKNTKNTRAVAVDISSEALSVAKENAKINGVSDRVDFILADALKGTVQGEFFAVLSNPPYVTDSAYEKLEREIYFEPRLAFVGGTDGADFYRNLTPKYKDLIANDGFIAYEIGYDQGKLLLEIARDNGMCAEIIRDFSGNDRVAVLRKAKRT